VLEVFHVPKSRKIISHSHNFRCFPSRPKNVTERPFRTNSWGGAGEGIQLRIDSVHAPEPIPTPNARRATELGQLARIKSRPSSLPNTASDVRPATGIAQPRLKTEGARVVAPLPRPAPRAKPEPEQGCCRVRLWAARSAESRAMRFLQPAEATHARTHLQRDCDGGAAMILVADSNSDL
jgi:hypothetical protein